MNSRSNSNPKAVRAKVGAGMEHEAALGVQHGCAPLGYVNATVGGERVFPTHVGNTHDESP